MIFDKIVDLGNEIQYKEYKNEYVGDTVTLGLSAGTIAYTAAAGNIFSWMAATGIGLIYTVPIAGLMAGLKASWTRKG